MCLQGFANIDLLSTDLIAHRLSNSFYLACNK